jgi:AcrR family transcriptional regulator
MLLTVPDSCPVSKGAKVARADAEANRNRIVAAAREALAESSDATMHAIAKRAGVGQGTLYRHFATREVLLVAAYREDIRVVLDLAPELLASHPPLEALRRWLERLASYGRIKHGVSQAVEAATRAGLSNEFYGETIAAITLLLDAGKRAASIRADVDAEDVLLMVGFLWRMDNEDWEKRSGHLLDLVTDALRPQGSSPAGPRSTGLPP